MDFENALFLTPFLAGAIFVVMGFLTLKFPPGKINIFFGYKTPRSMKSQEHWNFAQKYGAKEMLKFGGILLLISIPGLFYHLSQGIANLIGMLEVIAVVVIMIARVERALKKRFGE